MLTTFNKQDKHGKTSHLKPVEIDDLVEFVKSLPYETPPGAGRVVGDEAEAMPGAA